MLPMLPQTARAAVSANTLRPGHTRSVLNLVLSHNPNVQARAATVLHVRRYPRCIECLAGSSKDIQLADELRH